MVLGGYETAEYETSVSNRAGKGRMLCARAIRERKSLFVIIMAFIALQEIFFDIW